MRLVLSEEELKTQLRAKGLPEEAVSFLSGIVAWFVAEDFATVSDLVERVTGRQPASADEVLRSLTVAAAH